MKNTFAFLVLGPWLGFSAGAFSQVDFLLIEDGWGKAGQANDKPVEVVLANDTELKGFQFVLEYESSLLAVDTVVARSPLSEMDLFFNQTAPGQLTVLVTSLQGKRLSAGAESVLQIHMTVSPNASPHAAALQLKDIFLADSSGHIIPTARADGYFIILGSNILRMGNGHERAVADTVAIDLYNEVACGALQFSFHYNAALLSVDTLLTTARSERMTLLYNEPKPGELVVLLYSLARDSISAGAGKIFDVVLAVAEDATRNSTAVVQPLVLKEVVLLRPSGAILDSQSLTGYFLIKNFDFGTSISESEREPEGFILQQNFPNPLSLNKMPGTAVTTIRYKLPAAMKVTLKIYNVLGEEVATLIDGAYRPAGEHAVRWDGRDRRGRLVAGGIYFYRLVAGQAVKIMKMTVMP